MGRHLQSARALRNHTEGDITLLGEHEDLATLLGNRWAFDYRTMVADPRARKVKGWAVVVRADSGWSARSRAGHKIAEGCMLEALIEELWARGHRVEVARA